MPCERLLSVTRNGECINFLEMPKYHSLKTKNNFLKALETRKPKSRCWKSGFLLRTLPLAYRRPSCHCDLNWLSLCLCVIYGFPPLRRAEHLRAASCLPALPWRCLVVRNLIKIKAHHLPYKSES